LESKKIGGCSGILPAIVPGNEGCAAEIQSVLYETSRRVSAAERDRSLFMLYGNSGAHRSFLTRRHSSFSLFLTGVLIALVCHGNLPFGAALATMNRPAEPPACSSLGSYSPEMRLVVEARCQIEHAMFNDDKDPPFAYQFDKTPSKVGEYEGVDCYSRAIKFEVAQSVPLSLRKLHPDTFTEDDEGYMAIGWLSGDAGRIPVAVVSKKAVDYGQR
jgi:hypothetical protein